MYPRKVLYISFIIQLFLANQVIAGNYQDTIPPVFTIPPQNLFISCDDALSIQLTGWINGGGFSEADNGNAQVMSLLTSNEALNLLLQSFASGCSNTGEIEVGFYAIDDCNNISRDTLFSNFVVRDTEAPEIIDPPISITSHCDSGIQDTLNNWLLDFGGATAQDNCSDSIFMSHYTWVDNLGNSGFVDFIDSTGIEILRDSCEWSVDVSFFFRDECDNINAATASFIIESDTIAPQLLFSPQDTTILCDQSIDNLVPIFQDDCDGILELSLEENSSQHIDTLNCEHYNYFIERIWTAADACGNTITDTLLIMLTDTVVPTLILEENLVLPCNSDLNEESIFLTVEDNCSPTEISFVDEVILDNVCQQQINRTWTVVDVCRNTFVANQTIQIQDFDIPVFDRAPSNLTLACDDRNIITTYRAWLDNNANAESSDNCSDITVLTRVPGNYTDTTEIINAEIPSLQFPECDISTNTLINQEVQIFAFDRCGNIATETAEFSLIDTVASTIIQCPDDIVFNLNTNDCFVEISLEYPIIEDNCTLTTDTLWSALLDNNFLFTNERVDTIDIEVGQHTIAFMTQDCGGNVSSCIQMIEIVDTIAPTIICVPNIDVFVGNDCQLEYTVPEIEDFSDNCFGDNNFSQTQPSNRFIDFSFNPTDSTYSAQNFPVEFNNIIIEGRLFRPIIRIEYALNIQPGSSVKLISEFGDVLLEITEGQCTPTSELLFLESNQFNVWALDMDVNFTVVFENNNGDGTTVCAPDNISPTDNSDEVSFFIMTLEYSDIIPTHMIIDDNLNIINDNEDSSILDPGTYNLNYSTRDRSGNSASCNTRLQVLDTIIPIIICKDTFINIAPSITGEFDIINELIIESATDNCGIPSTSHSPTSISCISGGQSIEVSVISIDENNNESRCTSNLSIVQDSLNPSFISGLCLADTLQLFSGISETIAANYLWTGPDNFTSNISDPIVTSINDDNSGIYRLEVTTNQGCIYEGEVEIEISTFDSPEIFSSQTIYCSGEDVLLNSTSFTEIVNYFWFEGISPNGILIGQTEGPSLSINPTVGEHFYYVEINGDNCNSNPSNTYAIEVLPIPEALITNPFITVCNGDDITLMSSVFDPNYTYEWLGPNGYTSSGQTPEVINNASSLNNGTYTLLIDVRGCTSDTVTAQVIVFDQLTQPIISGESILCVGQSTVLTVNNITNATRYRWFNNGILFNTTSTNNLIIPSITENQSGTWTVITEDGLCTSDLSEEFIINVEAQLTIGASNNSPICEGEEVTLTSTFIPGATYQWVGPQGNTFDGREITIEAIDGVYTIFVTTESNCESSTTTNVSVSTKPIITALSNTSLPCMDGNTPISLVPSVFPIGNYTYSWSGPNNFVSNEEIAVINDAGIVDNGSYLLVVSNGDCVSESSSTTINISLIPQVALLSNDILACENSDARIEILNPVSGNATWIWTTPVGIITTTEPFLEIIDITDQNIGQYAVIQDQNGCRSEMSSNTELSIIDIPVTPTITGNTIICEGETLILTTENTQSTNYVWNTPQGTISQNSSEFIIENISLVDQGIYQVTSEMSSCISDISLPFLVEVLEQPMAPIPIDTNIEICNTGDNDLELCINNPPQGFDRIQILDNTSGTILLEGTTLCYDLNFLLNSSQTSFSLSAIVVRNDCFSDESVPVQINISNIPEEIYSIDSDSLILCNLEFFNLTPDNIVDGSTFKWMSPDPDINIFQNQNENTSFSNLRTGLNTLIIESSFGNCGPYGRDTLSVIVIDELIAENDNFDGAFDNDIIIAPLLNDNIMYPSLFEIIQQPDRGELIIENNIVRYSPESGFVGNVDFTYEVCYVDCPDICDQAIVNIEIGDNIACFAGNVITPNNDGTNDNFVIPCLDSGNFQQNSLIVFNQWGDEIFSAAPYTNNWAGTFDGSTLPVGTYFYILDLGDGSRPLQGFLILEL